ncbi:uncharacterized protein [Dermacentor albipictus]|uniref:uncharacterized protein isoform X2 n=1 Tax=Dermacentor albipictus TaxID=60249 RepID=UPI0038FC3874
MASQGIASVAAGASNGAPSQPKPGTEEDGMDFSEALTPRKDETNTTILTDAEDLRRFTREPDEDGWQTVLTLRQKRQQAKERLQAKRNEPSQKEQNSPPIRRRKVRRNKLPPLPRDDFKIILRPHQGLPLKTLTSPMLAEAVISACHNKVKGEQFILRIKQGSNIAIVSTSEEETANLLRKITALTVNGKTHAFNAYAATGEGAVRGVIHGLPPHTPGETIKANLRVRTQGIEIIQARMLGNSKSAVITFLGTVLPRFVYYCGGEMACRPYRNSVQVCKICHSVGHRRDVCPQPDTKVCRICGALEPEGGHECSPRCAACGGQHLTGDRSCKKRLKQTRPQGRPRSGGHKAAQQHRPRWFATEDEELELSDFPELTQWQEGTPSKFGQEGTSRSRSRSRTRRRSRQRSRSTSLARNVKPLAPKQERAPQAKHQTAAIASQQALVCLMDCQDFEPPPDDGDVRHCLDSSDPVSQ